MDAKIRHKLIEIDDHVSDRIVILITNDRWLRILEVIRHRSCKILGKSIKVIEKQ